MRTLLALVLALLCSTAEAAIFQNSFTTNSNQIFATTSSSLYPLMIDSATGTPTANGVMFSPSFHMTGTNGVFAGNLSLNGRTNLLSIVSNQLYLDGVPVTSTASTPVNNFYATNIFVQNGSHNTMIITNSLTLQSVKTNVLATTATGLVTNVNYGTGLTWTPSTLTLSASGGGDTTGTNIVTLTQTGTNISQMDFALVQNGGAFKLSLTNNGYISSPANVVTTSFKKAWLIVQQPSTGTCILQFTNGVAGFAWSEGVSPVIDTNNGSVAVFEFVSDVFTNGLAHGALTRLSKTATNL